MGSEKKKRNKPRKRITTTETKLSTVTTRRKQESKLTNVMVLLAGTKTEFAMSRESSVLELHEKVVEHGKTINVLPSGHQILLYREADILDFHATIGDTLDRQMVLASIV